MESNFEIKFFKTANGREPVREYLKDMALTNEKVTRDTLDTISELLMMLKARVMLWVNLISNICKALYGNCVQKTDEFYIAVF